MRTALVLLVAALVSSALAVDMNTTMVDWSFDACRQDPSCASRWQLVRDTVRASATAYERRKFDEMMAIFLERREDGGVGAVDMMVACAGQSRTDECNAVRYMWLGMLREAHVCQTNEEWVVGHGCHCMDGKHCNVDCTDEALSDLWSFTVAVGIVGVGVLSVFVWEVRKEEDLSRAVEQRLTAAANNHYLAQARLYVAENAAALMANTNVPVQPLTRKQGVQI